MKKLITYSFLLFLFATTIVSCEKDNNPTVVETVTDNLQQSKWVVTKLTYSGTDQTQTLNGFEFTFLSNGNVTAFKPDVNPTVTGVWNVYEANNETIFYINFSGNFVLGSMGNDWIIVEQNPNLIRLEDYNSATTDQLTLVKI